MQAIFVLALGLATGAAFGQAPVVGVNVRGAGHCFTSTADTDFVTNFVNTGPTGGAHLFAIDYDVSATTLWAVDDMTNEYGTLDPLSGTFTPLGVIPGISGASGLTASSDGATWYLCSVGGAETNLFVGDITTGAFSLVGPMTGAGLVVDISMSRTGRLIAHSITTNSFYDIDLATAAATLIGSHGFVASAAQGMDFDWSTDTLYAAIHTGGGAGHFCSIDTMTGAATVLATTTPLDAEMEIAIRTTVAPPNVVPPGSDFWITPGNGETRLDLVRPAGLFGPGSLPFMGVVELRGEPLTGTGLSGGVDTIFKRRGWVDLPTIGWPGFTGVSVVALSLVSLQPITIDFGSSTSRYEVHVSLSSFHPQPLGTMDVVRTHADGGTFSIYMDLVVRLRYVKVAGANGVDEISSDFGGMLQLHIPAPGSLPPCWSFSDGGFDFAASPGGTVDHDANPITAQVPFGPTTWNFHAGVNTQSGCPPQLRLTQGQGPSSAQGVLPARMPMLVGRTYCFPGSRNSTGCVALLNGLGSYRVIDNSFSLEARGMPPHSFGYFLAARGQLVSPSMPVGSQGNLCVGPAIGREVGGVIFDSGPTGSATVLADLLAMPLPTGPVAVLPGDTWYFQGWHRDANPSATSNLTDALEVRFR